MLQEKPWPGLKVATDATDNARLGPSNGFKGVQKAQQKDLKARLPRRRMLALKWCVWHAAFCATRVSQVPCACVYA